MTHTHTRTRTHTHIYTNAHEYPTHTNTQHEPYVSAKKPILPQKNSCLRKKTHVYAQEPMLPIFLQRRAVHVRRKECATQRRREHVTSRDRGNPESKKEIQNVGGREGWGAREKEGE